MLSVGPLDAQVAVELGDRVRVRAVGGATVVGEVAHLAGGRLQVRGESGRLHAWGHDGVGRLERSLGHRSHVVKGALIGGGIGFAIGAGFFLMLVEGLCENESCSGDYPVAIAFGGGLGAAAGGTVGLLFGWVLSGERWEPATLGAPGPERVGFGLGWSPELRAPMIGLTITP